MPGGWSIKAKRTVFPEVPKGLIGTSLPGAPGTNASGIDPVVLTSVNNRIQLWHLLGDVTLI